MAGQHQIWEHNILDGITKVFSGDGYERNLNGSRYHIKDTPTWCQTLFRFQFFCGLYSRNLWVPWCSGYMVLSCSRYAYLCAILILIWSNIKLSVQNCSFFLHPILFCIDFDLFCNAFILNSSLGYWHWFNIFHCDYLIFPYHYEVFGMNQLRACVMVIYTYDVSVSFLEALSVTSELKLSF